MCMFTLYIVFHRNEEYHDDITSVQIAPGLIDTKEIVNEIVQQLEETKGAQQQVWSEIMKNWAFPTKNIYSPKIQCSSAGRY